MSAIVVAVVFASALTVWLVVETRKVQRTVAQLLSEGSPIVTRDMGTLPGELRWQLVFSILVLLVLVVAAIALVGLFRALSVTQKSLREVKMLAWNILASMGHAVLTTNREGVITSINPRGHELLNVDSDCVGRPIADISTEDIRLDDISENVLRTGAPSPDNDLRVSRGNREHHFRVDCHLLTDRDENVLGTVLHVSDATGRVMMEERLRRMERFMGLGTLAAGLHHEISNPLSALSLYVQLLEEQLEGNRHQEVAKSLAVLKTEVARIGGVLNSFRDFASVQELNRSEADLAEIVDRTVRLIRPQAEHQNVQVTVEPSGDGLPHVSVDVAKLEQVLLNVVLNGLDAMPEGGKLTIRLSQAEGKAHVDIADTGPGIPQDIRRQVFDPYFSAKSEGSGMGLAISDKIMRQHGGRIDFETGPEGTVFRLSLAMENPHD
jgi:signal transduction histidine kinase